MRKILISILFPVISFSQDDEDFSDSLYYKDFESEIGGFEAIYGNHFYQNPFKNFNTLEDSKFGNPLQSVGIALTVAYFRNSAHKDGMHLSYSQILPQSIALNDSTSGKINGFNFSWNIYGLDLTPKSSFSSVMLGIGFNAGRLRTATDNAAGLKNPYFAPAIFFHPTLYFGRLSIGVRADYQLDVSKPGWRKINFSDKPNNTNLDSFRQTGLLTYFCIGLKFQ